MQPRRLAQQSLAEHFLRLPRQRCTRLSCPGGRGARAHTDQLKAALMKLLQVQEEAVEGLQGTRQAKRSQTARTEVVNGNLSVELRACHRDPSSAAPWRESAWPYDSRTLRQGTVSNGHQEGAECSAAHKMPSLQQHNSVHSMSKDVVLRLAARRTLLLSERLPVRGISHSRSSQLVRNSVRWSVEGSICGSMSTLRSLASTITRDRQMWSQCPKALTPVHCRDS